MIGEFIEIVRCDTLYEAWGEPMIEVRNAGERRFMLAAAFSDEEVIYFDGPFPNAAVAEAEGIERAEQHGVEKLNVVHTSAK